MSERKTDDATLIAAVRILSRTITTEDGVIPACLAEAANRLETLVEERRWIPVGERLPECEKDVSALLDTGVHEVAGYEVFDNGHIFWTLKSKEPVTVTHWQPLPPGPEVPNG